MLEAVVRGRLLSPAAAAVVVLGCGCSRASLDDDGETPVRPATDAADAATPPFAAARRLVTVTGAAPGAADEPPRWGKRGVLHGLMLPEATPCPRCSCSQNEY